jgi:hypothetical protein
MAIIISARAMGGLPVVPAISWSSCISRGAAVSSPMAIWADAR